MPIVRPNAAMLPERYGYIIPALPYIGDNERTARLLNLERRAIRLINDGALEWQQVLSGATGHKVSQYQEALPEALAAILNGVVTHAADAAAIAYLRSRSYTVTDTTLSL